MTPFDPSLGKSISVPIVDAAIVYDCPFTLQSYLLIVRNGLYLPHLDHNLIPPFILSEAGLEVNPIPKIHSKDPTVHDHSIYFPDADVRIPLKLNGIFSYFHSRAPTNDEIEGSNPLFLTPDSTTWDPYSTHYEKNEESMMDWEGNIMESRYRKKQLVEMPEFEDVTVSVQAYEACVDSAIAEALSACTISDNVENDPSIPRREYKSFAAALSAKAEEQKFKTSMGNVSSGNIGPCDLWSNPIYTTLDDLEQEFEIGAVAKQPNKISADFLSKIWNIKHDQADKVLRQTTQLNRQGADNDLSRQF